MSVLFTPIRISGLECPNRIVMPPMVRGTPSMPRDVVETDGRVTDAVVEHYRRRAAAGTGMIIVEATAVDEHGRVWQHGLNAYADAHTPDLARLAAAIRAEGAIAAIQLVHGGPQSSPGLTGVPAVGPSAVSLSAERVPPRALSVREIEGIERRFAEAAVHAADAGFQVVEVHGAHGFLLDSFLMARRNQRTDAYGGSVAGRMRFLLETCRGVRTRLAGRALLGCRISLFNKRDEGFSRQDLAELVRGLEEAGVELLHVSTDGVFRGVFGGQQTIGRCVKDLTAVPVIVAGGVTDASHAERLVAEGHADLAAVGRAMLKDADWVLHAREALGAAGASL